MDHLVGAFIFSAAKSMFGADTTQIFVGVVVVTLGAFTCWGSVKFYGTAVNVFHNLSAIVTFMFGVKSDGLSPEVLGFVETDTAFKNEMVDFKHLTLAKFDEQDERFIANERIAQERKALGDALLARSDGDHDKVEGFSQRLILIENDLVPKVASLLDGQEALKDQLRAAAERNIVATKEVGSKVDGVAHEVKTNGGTELTVGDGIKRIEAILTPNADTGS